MSKYIIFIGGVCVGAAGCYKLINRKKHVEVEETPKKSYNPVEKAYNVLLNSLMMRSEDVEELSASMQEAIGYLGEALDG